MIKPPYSGLGPDRRRARVRHQPSARQRAIAVWSGAHGVPVRSQCRLPTVHMVERLAHSVTDEPYRIVSEVQPLASSRAPPFVARWTSTDKEVPMEATSTNTQLVPPTPPLFDDVRLAVGGFLARYSGNTRTGYGCDLRAWFAWCAQAGVEVLAVRRVHIELYARWMEEDRHLARATIGRRLSTVAGFYRFAVVDGYLAESPAEHVWRPKVDTDSATLGLDRMELGPSWPRPLPPVRSTTPWPVCWACWACGSRRLAASTSSTWAPIAATEL